MLLVKKVLTNKFVKPSIPIQSLAKIIDETKAEGVCNSINESTATSETEKVVKDTSLLKPKVDQPEVPKAGNTAKLKAGYYAKLKADKAAKAKAVILPPSVCETSNAGKAKRDKVVTQKKKFENNDNIVPKGRPARGKDKTLRA